MKHKLAELLPYARDEALEAARRVWRMPSRTAEKLLVVGPDYDADGATACCGRGTGLTALGAKVGYISPTASNNDYGLSPEIARLAAEHPARPADYRGQRHRRPCRHREARRLGWRSWSPIIICPETAFRRPLIVNRISPAASSPAKNLAGVGECSMC